MSAAMSLWHYAIPKDGRWLVCYRLPGDERWTPVMDCPTESAARAECDRLNKPIAVRVAADWHQEPEALQ